jgi:hypothetical protein
MSDLVKRLRDPVNNWNSGGRFEAADRIETLETMLRCHTDGRLVMLARIEALEAALRKISKLYGNYGYAEDIARAALAEGQDK